MPLNNQAKSVLEQRAAANLPAADTISPAQARANSRLRPPLMGPNVEKEEDKLVTGSDGKLTARIFTPAGNGPFPVLVWFHGGGWVLGDLDRSDGVCRSMCASAGCIVVSIDYRLAPETKFPGPVEDCYEATKWVYENALSLNGDPDNIMVGGDSAGGNLAAAVSIMAKDRKTPKIIFQVLVYPVIAKNFTTQSYKDNGEAYGLTEDTMVWFWDQYLKNESDADNPYAAPIKNKNPKGLPEAFLLTAEYDPLRDEGEAYAKFLNENFVKTEYICYEGMIHGFFGMLDDVDASKQAIADVARAIKNAVSQKI